MRWMRIDVTSDPMTQIDLKDDWCAIRTSSSFFWIAVDQDRQDSPELGSYGVRAASV